MNRVLAIILVMALPACTNSQPGSIVDVGNGLSDRAGISGRVIGLDRDGLVAGPLANAIVQVGNQSAATDSDGFWRISPVPANADVVTVFRPGYAPSVETIVQVGNGSPRLLTSYLVQALHMQDVNVADGAVVGINLDDDIDYEASLVLPPGFIDSGLDTVGLTVSLLPAVADGDLTGFPAGFSSQRVDSPNQTDLTRSFGALNISFHNGEFLLPAQTLAGDARIQLRLANDFAAELPEGTVVELSRLDPDVGMWIPEQDAIVVVQNGFRYAEWTAGSGQWWNLEKPLVDHACLAVDVDLADPTYNALLPYLNLVVEGADYAGATPPQPLAADGTVVATGWNQRQIRLYLQYGDQGTVRWPLLPEFPTEGIPDRGTFLLPDTVASGYWNTGPDGGPLDAEKHCGRVKRQFDLNAGIIEGFVLDAERAPVTDTVVSIPELGLAVRPSAEGFFKFDPVPWQTDGSSVYELQAAAVRGQRFAPVMVSADDVRVRVDLVIDPASQPPWFVQEILSDTQPGPSGQVEFTVVARDDRPGIRWDVTTSSGEIEDTSAEEVPIDGTHQLTITGTWTGGEPDAGETMTVTIMDEDGLKTEKSFGGTWANAAPVVSLKGPNYVESGQSASFVILADDPEADDLTVTWAYNGTTITTGGNGLAATIPAVAAGAGHVTIELSDGSNHVELLHTLIGTDGTDAGPDTVIELAPAPESGSDVTVGFAAAGSIDRFECSLDNASFSVCNSPLALTGLSNGIHTLLVRAVSGGVADSTPAFSSWRTTE